MPQHDMVIDDQTFPAFRADMILAFKALVSQNQGSSAPSTTFSYMPWLDTSGTPWVLKIRNAANDAWITTYEVDDSDDSWNIPLATSVDIADAGTFFTGTTAEAALQELGPFVVPSIVAGDTFYGSGGDTVARLAKGSDGEVLTLASGIPSWVPGVNLTRFSPVATTSGTTKTISGIAAGANRITIMLNVVSLTGNDQLRLRIGDAGGIENSNYNSGASTNTSDGNKGNSTDGFILTNALSSSETASGTIVLSRLDGDTWTSHGVLAVPNPEFSAGGKTLTAELTQIQLGEDGSSSFDAGSFSIFVE